MRGIINKNNFVARKNNDSYPWKSEDKSSGLHSKIDVMPTGIDKFQSHHSYKFMGMQYQFHSPFELPTDENGESVKFFSVEYTSSLFFVDAEISELGDSLMNYGLEKFVIILSRTVLIISFQTSVLLGKRETAEVLQDLHREQLHPGMLQQLHTEDMRLCPVLHDQKSINEGLRTSRSELLQESRRTVQLRALSMSTNMQQSQICR
jgi:hypothetical protein